MNLWYFPGRQLGGPLAALLVITLLGLSSVAGAEGSGILLDPNNNRAYLETGNPNKGDLGAAAPLRKTSFFVYANANEIIELGSSALDSSLALTSAAINVYSGEVNLTSGTRPAAVKTCKPGALSVVGVIQNRAQELAGPNTVAGSSGYTPCSYPVTTTGVYTVEFLAPVPTNDNAPANTITSNGWGAPTTSDQTIGAWDITVRNGSTAIPGRVWTTYLAMNTGGNGRPTVLNLYVLTKDGYLYKVKQNLDPYGFIFFANNKGLTNAAGDPSFTSNTVANATYGSPVVGADSGSYITHKLFLNSPASDLPSSASGVWIRSPSPSVPPTPTGLTFTGRDGTPGFAGSTNGYLSGGTFTFTNPGNSNYSYRLTIPLASNGTNVDRVLVGTATPGSNTVSWDGLDGNGNAVPAGTSSYTARVELLAGEVHFPLLDSENATGLNIVRQNVSGTGTAAPGMVFWDDRPLTRDSSGQSLNITGAPSPDFRLNGVDSSSTPQHSWSSTFGDKKAMDMWAYYPSSPASSSNSVTVRTADISIVKTAGSGTVPVGGQITYTLTIQNKTANTPGQPVVATVDDALPAGITARTWGCPTGCATTGGTGALSTTVSLNGQAPVTITVTDTLSTSVASGTTITNTATVTRGQDSTDPDMTNNTSSVSVTVTPPAPTITLSKQVRNIGTVLNPSPQSTAAFGTSGKGKPGEYLEYCIAYQNTGAGNATNLVINDTIAASGPAQMDGYGTGQGILYASGATLASGATATPTGTLLTSAGGDDAGTLTASSLSVSVGTVYAAPGGAGTPSKGVVCFKARVP